MSEGLAEIKKALGERAKDWEEFKKTNDDLLEKKANGDAVAEIEQKIDKISDGLDKKTDEITKAVEKLEADFKKKSESNGSNEKEELQIKKDCFNRLTKGIADGAKGEDLISSMSDIEKKLLSVQSDPDGGITVFPDTSGPTRGQVFETSPLRQVASVTTTGTSEYEGFYDDDEAQAFWTGETQVIGNSTTPELGKYTISTRELQSNPPATLKILEDSSINMEQWLMGKVDRKFTRRENNAFVLGDGVLQPKGFLTYPASADSDIYERGAIGQVDSEANSVVAFDDFINLQYSLKQEWRDGAVFGMNRGTLRTTRKLKDLDGQYLWEPSVQAGEPSMILGQRTIELNDMPDIGNDTLPVVFANFADAYMIVDRLGVSVLRDPYSSYPTVVFKTRKRVGGQVIGFDSIKLLKVTAP